MIIEINLTTPPIQSEHKSMKFYAHLSCFTFMTRQVIMFFFTFLANYTASANERFTYIVHMDKSHTPKIFPNHQLWYSFIHGFASFL